MKYTGRPRGGEGRGPSNDDGLSASNIFEGGSQVTTRVACPRASPLRFDPLPPTKFLSRHGWLRILTPLTSTLLTVCLGVNILRFVPLPPTSHLNRITSTQCIVHNVWYTVGMLRSALREKSGPQWKLSVY